jgi:hypothetical protein
MTCGLNVATGSLYLSRIECDGLADTAATIAGALSCVAKPRAQATGSTELGRDSRERRASAGRSRLAQYMFLVSPND